MQYITCTFAWLLKIQNACSRNENGHSKFVFRVSNIVVSRSMEGMYAIHLTHNSMFEIRLTSSSGDVCGVSSSSSICGNCNCC